MSEVLVEDRVILNELCAVPLLIEVYLPESKQMETLKPYNPDHHQSHQYLFDHLLVTFSVKVKLALTLYW